MSRGSEIVNRSSGLSIFYTLVSDSWWVFVARIEDEGSLIQPSSVHSSQMMVVKGGKSE